MERAKHLLSLVAALSLALGAGARDLGFGIDSFNRVVPGSATEPKAFSPASFEIDCVLLAEAVDSVRRSVFANALQVMDEFEPEYGALAHRPFVRSETNGMDVVWARALAVDDARKVDPAYRLLVQEFYGAEVCGVARARGVEAWVGARFSGGFGDWRFPTLPSRDSYALVDLVDVTAEAAPSNGWKKVLPTHTLYRQPLLGGADFYALVPKAGRPVSSVRARLTSVTVGAILAAAADITDPPVPVRVALPAADFVTTNDLAGAFTYFRFPTAALKPFPAKTHPSGFSQTVRCRLKSGPVCPDAERLDGPFLFFIHDPSAKALAAIGIWHDSPQKTASE